MAFAASITLTDRQLVQVRPQPVTYSDTAENDSDKTLTLSDFLATGQLFLLTGVHIEYAATATAGTRTIVTAISDGTPDVIVQVPTSTSANVTAGNSLVIEQWPQAVRFTATGYAVEALPSDMWLGPEHTIRVYDSSATAAAADDMVVHIRGLIYG